MAENGKIIRNGAEIQIDENGNVVARPAEGQELIVEDDARVGTLEAGSVSTEEVNNVEWQTANRSFADALSSAGQNGTVIVTSDEIDDSWVDYIENGQTIIGAGGEIDIGGELLGGGAAAFDVSELRLINLQLRNDRNGDAIRMVLEDSILSGVTVKNEDGGDSARGLEIIFGTENVVVSGGYFVGNDFGFAVSDDVSNVSIGDNFVNGGIEIDSGATNINESNNTVI